MTKFTASKLIKMGVVSALAGTMMAAPLMANADMTGNIGMFSKYVLRGITNNTENDGTTMQGGLDYTHASGFYAGYWGSNLDYGNHSAQPHDSDGDGDLDTILESGTTRTGFENDFYLGYAGKAGDFSYNVGLIQYYYIEVEDSDGLEFAGSVGYGPVTAGLKYLTKDVAWGNTGDIYWTLGYSTKLPRDFSFGATLGYYTYEDKGDFIPSTDKDSAFRHLDLTLSHPIAQTGADMSITYVIGGDDRQGTEQENTVVFGVKYGFGI